MSKLSAIYAKLVADVKALPGYDQAHNLMNGARIAVRLRDNLQTVTFSRGDVELGAVELDTFKTHCAIPEHARRIPAIGQNLVPKTVRARYYVAFQWAVEPETQTALVLGPAARNSGDELFPDEEG